MRVDWIEPVPIAGGGTELAAHMSFFDPWDAASLLIEGADADSADPVVQAWAYEILRQTAAAIGDAGGPRVSPALRDAAARAIQKSVQQWIRFVQEPKEKFQAARVTMRTREGDCDCQARLVAALAGALGIPWDLVFFEGWDPVAGQNVPIHAVTKLQDSDGTWQWAETTLAAEYGEEPYAALARLGADLPDDQNPFAGSAPPASNGMGFLGFISAADVQARKDELHAVIESLDVDVIACTTLDDTTKSAWNSFQEGWTAFYVTVPNFVTAGDQNRQASEYQTEIGQWQTQLAASCKLSAPPLPAAPPPDTPIDADNIAATIKVVAIGAAVVAGAIAVREVARVAR